MALGMGLSHCRSAGATRLLILLLIAHIAQLALRLIGEAAKAPAAGTSVDEHRAANSSSNWTRIPRQTGQPFQSKLDTDSTTNWTVK